MFSDIFFPPFPDDTHTDVTCVIFFTPLSLSLPLHSTAYVFFHQCVLITYTWQKWSALPSSSLFIGLHLTVSSSTILVITHNGSHFLFGFLLSKTWPVASALLKQVLFVRCNLHFIRVVIRGAFKLRPIPPLRKEGGSSSRRGRSWKKKERRCRALKNEIHGGWRRKETTQVLRVSRRCLSLLPWKFLKMGWKKRPPPGDGMCMMGATRSRHCASRVVHGKNKKQQRVAIILFSLKQLLVCCTRFLFCFVFFTLGPMTRLCVFVYNWCNILRNLIYGFDWPSFLRCLRMANSILLSHFQRPHLFHISMAIQAAKMLMFFVIIPSRRGARFWIFAEVHLICIPGKKKKKRCWA